MMRRFWTLIAAAICLIQLAFQLCAAETSSARPNILLIIPDQMRAQAMGCMGNPDVKTPALDKLASEGILLTNFFANTPVCSPARATMLTGKYPHKHGLIANDLRLHESETTIAEILKSHGYKTGFIGKWHIDGGARQPGFIPPGERRQGFDFWAANECDHTHFANHYFRDEPTPIEMEDYETRVWTDVAIEFMKENKEKPFFLEVAMGPPHDPYKAPDKFATMYDPGKLTMRKNWSGAVSREQIAQYYGMISDVDEQVGRMMKSLDDLGIAKNTIVLFTSDHGDMLGSQGLKLKRKPWEESIHIPGIIRFPEKLKGGQKLDVLFSHVDMAPTLLSFCNMTPPAAMQGRDLSARLRGQTKDEPSYVFFQIFTSYAPDGLPEPWRGIRTKNAMYARFERKDWVLYDVANDPYEMQNLVSPEKEKTDGQGETKRPINSILLRQRMSALVDEAMARTEDRWSYNISERVEEKSRLYFGPAFYSYDEYRQWIKDHPGEGPKD